MLEFVSGGVSGAITDAETEEAMLHAIQAYEAIRNDKYDIEKIVKNTGFSEIQVAMIKNYLFYHKHKMADGNFKRFDPGFYVAQSWRRLAYEPENIQKHDLLLLKHEAMELSLVMQGYDQDKAHQITEERYNYKDAATQFYLRLRKNQKRHPKETPINYKNMVMLSVKQQAAEEREDAKERNYVSHGGSR